MERFKDQTLQQYLQRLSERTPTPGGGSAAALAGALGAALISMVANYSLGKGKPPQIEKEIKKILQQSEKLRKRLLQLVDLDAQAYLGVVKARKKSDKIKKTAAQRAREVPLEICQRCYEAVELTPYLVHHGNTYLISDVQVANELLLAAFKSAVINVQINQ